MIADTSRRLLDQGIRIEGTSHQPLSVTAHGQPARLAVIDASGQVVAAGDEVGRECAAVIVEVLHNFWRCQGWQRAVNTNQTVSAGMDTLARTAA
jgi:hypothetical protein